MYNSKLGLRNFEPYDKKIKTATALYESGAFSDSLYKKYVGLVYSAYAENYVNDLVERGIVKNIDKMLEGVSL